MSYHYQLNRKLISYPMNYTLAILSTLMMYSMASTVEVAESLEKLESLDDFIKKEVSHIHIEIYCTLHKATYFNSKMDDLMTKIAVYQKREKGQYEYKDIRMLVWWIYDIHYKVKSVIMKDAVLKRISASDDLIDLIKKRHPGGGLFHQVNVSYFPVDISNKFDHFMMNDECIRRLEDVFMDKLAYLLVQEFGLDSTIDDKIYDWKRYRENDYFKEFVVDEFNKEFNKYVEDEDFTILVDKMIGFFTELYQTTLKN